MGLGTLLTQPLALDRFIPELPRDLRRSRFKLTRRHKKDLQAHAYSPPLSRSRSFHIQNSFFFVDANLTGSATPTEVGSAASSSPASALSLAWSKTSKSAKQRQGIAKALGFTRRRRILTFKPKTNELMLSELLPPPPKPIDDFSKLPPFHGKRPPAVLDNPVPYKVLDAPGLRNDYYSNTICFSKDSDWLAVGLADMVYTWSETKGTVALKRPADELISCLCYSSDGLLTVGTKAGRISIYAKGAIKAGFSEILKPSKGVSVIRWLSSGTLFYAGDELGDVALYEVAHRTLKNKFSVKIRCQFKTSTQQVCGLDISTDGTQLAVGVNDNLCHVFNIENLLAPKKLFQLKHAAAVKAVSFCPWLPHLLATGAGSKDRCIRFWHSCSGTLIHEYQTDGQITALIWSPSNKEILATFGFGAGGVNVDLFKVYSYPDLKLVRRVAAPSELRVLTADLSADLHTVSLSTSEGSVRIFHVWKSSLGLRAANCDGGLYKSKLIELEEGVNEVEGIR